MPDLRKHRERKSRVCMTKSRRANERQHKPHTSVSFGGFLQVPNARRHSESLDLFFTYNSPP